MKDTKSVGRLDELRHDIRAVDRELLRLIARRMDLARTVGAEKHQHGIALRDFAVEKSVLESADADAREFGVAQELAQTVLQQLIEEACRVQEEAHYSSYRGDAETIVIVGGAGKMGQWFARFFANQGHRVRIFDPQASDETEFAVIPRLDEALTGSTVALIAVPLDAVASTITTIAATSYRGIVCDIASLKEHLRPVFLAARRSGLLITSIHPMFGPSARTLADKVVCFCDCGVPDATKRMAAFFRETAVRMVELSLEDHDRVAAYVLGLSHFINLLFGRVLEQSGLPLDSLARVGSTTFSTQLRTTANVLRENPNLYFEIQKLNPSTPAMLEAVERALADLAAWIGTSDLNAFAAAMIAGRQWVDTSDAAAGL